MAYFIEFSRKVSEGLFRSHKENSTAEIHEQALFQTISRKLTEVSQNKATGYKVILWIVPEPAKVTHTSFVFHVVGDRWRKLFNRFFGGTKLEEEMAVQSEKKEPPKVEPDATSTPASSKKK